MDAESHVTRDKRSCFTTGKIEEKFRTFYYIVFIGNPRRREGLHVVHPGPTIKDMAVDPG